MATDANYLQHACVAIASLLKNTNANLHIHILEEYLTDKHKSIIAKLKSIREFELDFIYVGDEYFKDWDFKRGDWSKAIYYRLALPSLIKRLNKVIYLDCDLVVMKDIQNLWNTDLSEVYAAAVEAKVEPALKKALSLEDDYPYFNSGVMVFNLKKMRTDNIEQTFIEKYESLFNVLKYPDQDILNVVFKNQYRILPLNWNLISSVYRNIPDYFSYDSAAVSDALSNPAVAHFTGRHKPWRVLKTSRHPCWKEYWKYLRLTPFKTKYYTLGLIKFVLTGRLKKPAVKKVWKDFKP